MTDTVAERWARLSPHVAVFGPADDQPRPAVMLFHGCGGVQAHLAAYSQDAADLGLRAFVIDSYAPRGWSRAFGLGIVCSGAVFRGAERAGDVLAALWGVAQRPDVDPARLALAGWSHGGWAIMDLMTRPLTSPGEAGLADASFAPLTGLKALALLYPYVGLGTGLTRRRWVRTAPTLGVICAKDHLGSPALHRTAYAMAGDPPPEIWDCPGTHAFDQPGEPGLAVTPMRSDPDLTAEARRRVAAHWARTLL